VVPAGCRAECGVVDRPRCWLCRGLLGDAQRRTRLGLGQEFAFAAEFRRCRDGMQESGSRFVGIQPSEEVADLIVTPVGKRCPVGPPVVDGSVALGLLFQAHDAAGGQRLGHALFLGTHQDSQGRLRVQYPPQQGPG